MRAAGRRLGSSGGRAVFAWGYRQWYYLDGVPEDDGSYTLLFDLGSIIAWLHPFISFLKRLPMRALHVPSVFGTPPTGIYYLMAMSVRVRKQIFLNLRPCC
jgi:hypothetical protein